MNCGLSNLDGVKRQLLAGSLAGETRFDAALQVVGLAAAGLFEAFTNRKLGYLAGDKLVVSGGRRRLFLPRYPVGSVASVKTRSEATAAWATEAGQPAMVSYADGMVDFGAQLGDEAMGVEITWTGGYWFDTKEPDDVGYPSAKPAATDTALGAVIEAVPDDLRGAWLLQCEAMWSARDKLGLDVVRTGSSNQFVTGSLAELKVIPVVETVLRAYVRYQLI